MNRFSWRRLWAVLAKEFIQMRRDRLTFAMMVGIPVMQLCLFGYAINTDPKHLPTAVVAAESDEFTRRLLSAMTLSDYFELVAMPSRIDEGRALLRRGEVQFLLRVPPDFGRTLARGERPQLLVEIDATDPVASGNAIAALSALTDAALESELRGPLAALNPRPGAVEVLIQRRYNPEGLTAYNIVPGLMGVILTMTLIMMTGLAIARERERGTFENLLAMPVRPLEIMLGKLIPYILVAYIQVAVILLAARLLFEVPIIGSLALLLGCVFAFVIANLSVGLLFSTLAKNQMQAMQMTFFFFLPSILLSGFMFPFRGMPGWAQTIGEALPLTHFLRIVRGILLKANSAAEVWPNLWPLLLFTLVVVGLGAKRFRRTLD
ncbi:MAG: ABC transporter permease [Xanthomonadales bacterium]|nr:putative multidrug ABC transporter permease YbhR [Xanthomonadales bacterium]MCC6594249.1 ABC transporter permease [Xanthomonadales bacterium]MCE7931680.1 ABC transporter permease [Xanthomonadales bacterium PRO6]